MKRTLITAAIAVTVAASALPAAAQDYRRDRYDDYRNERGYDRNDRDGRYDRSRRGERPPVITVRTPRGTIVAERGERLYYRLKEGPYHFKDGRIYTYDDCYRGRCRVDVYDPYWTSHPRDVVTAPPVDRLFGRGRR